MLRPHPPFLGTLASLLWLPCLLVGARAGAQDALVGARTALTTYEVDDGGSTLSALTALGPIAVRGDAEARYLRAVAGVEIDVAARLLGDEPLRGRLATALGVSADDLEAHLGSELEACRGGAFGRGVEEARELFAMSALSESDASQLFTHLGPHRDALFAVLVARSDDRGALVPDPCASASDPTARGTCDWDESSRRELAAIREAYDATARAAHERSAGDPFLALIGAALDGVPEVLSAVTLSPLPELPEILGVAPVDSGSFAPLDLLVVVAETEVHLRVLPRVRVAAGGALVWVQGESEGAVVVPVPSDLPPVPQPYDALVAAARALGLSPGARVGVAPTAAVPSDRIVRALLSLARAEIPAAFLVAEHDDETLACVPLTTRREVLLETVGARVRILMGGYGFARGIRGIETRIPRVHGEGGLAFDLPSLASRFGSGRYASVALDVMGTVPAAELVRVTFAVSAPSRSVILLMP